MKRILVWPGGYHKYESVCCKCRGQFDALSSFLLIEIPSPCFSKVVVGHIYVVERIIQYQWGGRVWRVCGSALCGHNEPFDPPPYDMLWLPRLFQYSGPEDRQALEETLLMLALAGKP